MEPDPVDDRTSSPAAGVVVEMMYPGSPEEFEPWLAPVTPVSPMALVCPRALLPNRKWGE